MTHIDKFLRHLSRVLKSALLYVAQSHITIIMQIRSEYTFWNFNNYAYCKNSHRYLMCAPIYMRRYIFWLNRAMDLAMWIKTLNQPNRRVKGLTIRKIVHTPYIPRLKQYFRLNLKPDRVSCEFDWWTNNFIIYYKTFVIWMCVFFSSRRSAYTLCQHVGTRF